LRKQSSFSFFYAQSIELLLQRAEEYQEKKSSCTLFEPISTTIYQLLIKQQPIQAYSNSNNVRAFPSSPRILLRRARDDATFTPIDSPAGGGACCSLLPALFPAAPAGRAASFAFIFPRASCRCRRLAACVLAVLHGRQWATQILFDPHGGG
jgi:hypothetical protein